MKAAASPVLHVTARAAAALIASDSDSDSGADTGAGSVVAAAVSAAMAAAANTPMVPAPVVSPVIVPASVHTPTAVSDASQLRPPVKRRRKTGPKRKFSAAAVEKLEALYQRDTHPDTTELLMLSEELQESLQRVREPRVSRVSRVWPVHGLRHPCWRLGA